MLRVLNTETSGIKEVVVKKIGECLAVSFNKGIEIKELYKIEDKTKLVIYGNVEKLVSYQDVVVKGNIERLTGWGDLTINGELGIIKKDCVTSGIQICSSNLIEQKLNNIFGLHQRDNNLYNRIEIKGNLDKLVVEHCDGCKNYETWIVGDVCEAECLYQVGVRGDISYVEANKITSTKFKPIYL